MTPTTRILSNETCDYIAVRGPLRSTRNVARMTDGLAGVSVVIVDADTVAGWRRVTPSLAQLESAISDLRRSNPGALITIVGDASLKWALPPDEQVRLDDWVNHQQVVLSPAGSKDGHVGFMASTARKATRLGMKPVIITDRAVHGCPIARIRHDGRRWIFDLENATVVDANRVVPTATVRRRRSGKRN